MHLPFCYECPLHNNASLGLNTNRGCTKNTYHVYDKSIKTFENDPRSDAPHSLQTPRFIT